MSTETTDAIEKELAGRQIAAFYSYKGGVGRTMAMCNVAVYLTEQLRARGSSSQAILCIDIDLQAPSVPMFLQPQETPNPERSLIKLLLDFEEKFRAASPEFNATDWLSHALSPEGDYVCRAQEERDLFILPAGLDPNNPKNLNARRLKELETRLPAAIEALLSAKETVRQALCTHYAYSLIDCRAGLPGIEFSIANAIADVLVLFFRPNSTQLNGIKLALATFLDQRQQKATDPYVPAIPVLSPRPAYTDPRIREISSLARSNIFKWLHAPTTEESLAHTSPYPRYSEFVELPFDKSVEIGETLLIQLGLGDSGESEGPTPIDDEAPLYLAYSKLAALLQKGNFHRDVLGAWMCEEEALQEGKLNLALEYRLCMLREEPDNIEHWEGIRMSYGEQALRNSTALHSLRAFCEQCRKKSDLVPKVQSLLWLADFMFYSDFQVRRLLLAEAWQEARRGLHDGLR